MVRLVLLFGPLLSLLSLATSGAARLRGDHDEETVAVDPHAAHVDEHDDDPDRGYRAFGRLVEKITILGVLVVALLVVGLVLSIFGVFGSDIWDPPV